MPKLYNTTTGEVEDVPFEEVNQGIISGEYQFQPGPAVPLENTSGEVYLMPANKASEIIIDHSWKFPSKEKTNSFFQGLQKDIAAADEEQRLEDEYGDSPIQAGLFGAARGVTLGLSDPLLTNLLDVDPERLRELEKRQPGISTTTEIGGALLPLLLPEPTSSTAAAARLGLLAARGVTGATAQAGRIAARALGKRLAGEVGKRHLAKGVAPLALGGAVEGALYGIGETLSEDALENKEMSAEAFVGNIGVGILLGGVAGGLLGGGKEYIARSAKSRLTARLLDDKAAKDFKYQTLKHAQRAGEKVSVADPRPLTEILSSENIIRFAPRDKAGKIGHGGFGRNIKSKIMALASAPLDKAKSFGAFMTDADENLVKEFFAANPQAQKLRKWAFASHPEKMNLAIGEGGFKDIVDKMYQKAGRMVELLTGGEKLAQVRTLLKGQDPAPMKEAVDNMLMRFLSTLEDMKAQPDIYMYRKPIVQMEQALFGKPGVKGLIGNIEDAPNAYEVFRRLDKAKKKAIDPLLKFGKNLQPTEEETINFLVRKIRTPMKIMLENPKVFGEAGKLQKKINRAANDYLTFQDMFRKNFTIKDTDTRGRYVFDINEDKIISFLNMRGRFHSTSSPRKLKVMNELVEQQRKIGALAEGIVPKTREYRRIVAGTDEGGELQQFDDIIDFFTDHNALRQKSWDELVLGKDRLILREGMTDLQQSIDKMATKLEEMQEQWIASFKLKDMAGGSKTQMGINIIHKLDRIRVNTMDKIKKGIIQMMRPAGEAGKGAARGAKAEGSAMQEGVKYTENLKGRQPKSDEKEQERFKKETDEVSQLYSDPHLMAARMADSTEEMSIAAPETALAVQQTAQRAIDYAFKNIPTSAFEGETLVDPDFKPSTQQLFRWRTVMRAIEDPLILTDQIAAGFVVPKTLETVQTVYPQMMVEIRKIMVEEAGKTKKLSIPQQMLASQVFGIQGPYMKLTPGLQSTYEPAKEGGLERKTNKVQNLENMMKTPFQRVSVA